MTENKDLSELSLQELRVLYPGIKATSKMNFLEKVSELNQETEQPEQALDSKLTAEEVIELPVASDNYEGALNWTTVIGYLESVSKSSKKILIKTESSFDADFLFNHVKERLFPILEENGTMVMASSTRRDFHFNGTCYCRFVCQMNYNHIKSLMAYNTFKEVVNEG